MRGFMPSRREAIRSFGGALVAGAFSVGTRTHPRLVGASEPPNVPMLVDTHLHIVSSKLGRAADASVPSAPFDLLQKRGGAEQLAKLITNELQAAHVGHALCMPTAEVSDQDPLGIQPTLDQAALIAGPKLHPVGVAHPERFDRDHLSRVEAVLKQGQVKAFKAYLGYFHYGPLSPGYRPYFRLAAKYNIPVIFHTGDTYSQVAKVKYAHPLQVDELAVDFPDTKFVLAHFGNPWIMDAAQVVYKNKNVWADLSAIVIGDAQAFVALEKDGVLDRAVQRIKEGIDYAEAPDKFLFGSDWPLSPIALYRDFVGRLFPEKHHAAVFSGNAQALFRL